MDKPKLYVLDTGTMKMDKNFMVAAHNPASIDNPNPPAEFVEFPVYAVLIDHPDGKILFDTGCNPEGMGENGRWPEGVQKLFPAFQDESCYLINRLEQLNLRPDDIKYVVASHLHLDHAGCLELFTNATIIVHDSELKNTMKQYAMTKDMGAYIWADINAWIGNDLKWKTVMPHEDELELVKGVKILNFGPGHAWGLLGLHIDLPGEGGVILASDAVYSAENYGPPVKIPGIIYDSLGYLSAVEKIKKYAERTNSQVWYGHDSKQFRNFIKSTEGFYE
ncbi:N-acyl homoserine lactonase family protein [Planomicrobium chinense]|uniref:N-acyl homoserine lactonase family protein n=1 Tax=Planococcus glaciei TaxID=459472 RepID=A0A1G8C3A3_9BACL|nr:MULTISPECIES: N-acyl homoserine lactonase family protein [Planococcus]ETP69414.1 beta-lactamase [Planococcus glaciei CHR43]KOF10489.1 beta-lactamase [Planococcus glaciei]MBX0316402.1 N-acyl homoserine lactonase family protein [Planococcus glaciei]MBZ5202669.1 N-acyl homoserine lactonase family protein [Planococcus chinensis]QKX51204.1 N-acyl homoserine lactonase family protein [Planococcus glaciei]